MMKRQICMLMVSLIVGTLSGWSDRVRIYDENLNWEDCYPHNGDAFKITKDVVAVDLRLIEKGVILDVSAANPNCLFYLNGQDKLPEGLDDSRLIIRDNVIDELIIQRDYPFCCSEPFKAVTALFIYTPKNEMINGQQAEAGVIKTGTLVLPFDAERAWLLDVNDDLGVEIPPSSEALNIYSYEGLEGNKALFRHVDNNQLRAKEPYLISMAHSSRIAFYAENVTFKKTQLPAYKEFGLKICFRGHTINMHLDELFYSWNYQENCFCLNVGRNTAFTAVIIDSSMLEPAQPGSSDGPGGQPGSSGDSGGQPGSASGGNGYPLEDNRLMVTIIGEEKTTGISTVASRGVQRVYTLSGQRLSTSDKSGLRPGIYIIGGRKVVVK